MPPAGTESFTVGRSMAAGMSIATTASLAVHLVTGAVWVGAITFTVVGVLPAARDGSLDAAPLESMARTLRNYSRGAAVLLVLTGGHLAATRYSVGSLAGTGEGHLVLAMVGLWLATTGLVEVATARILDGTGGMKVREPARESARLLQVAAVLGALILVDGAVLIGGL